MVDFKQRFHNTDKFRQAALHFLQYGTYTDAPRGTSDYVKYWDQETERCLNGYTAEDGEYITGYHYFYLNYSPIYTVKVSDYIDRYGIKRQRRERSFGFPSFWDYDAFYFYAIEDAELAGQHMAVMKARKKGYSFKGASMLVRNYEFIPGSKNFAIASEQKFLIGDGLLTKAWQIMDFVDKNTAWAKQRLKSTAMERTSGFKVKDEFGKETEQGYQSSIIGITLKNDPERIRGTRGKLFLWEEAGKFENLQEAWSIARASLELDDGTTFGAMQIMYGTGGTEGCLMTGSKLYDVSGNLTTIESISEGMNILSYDTSKQKVVEDKVVHIGIKRKPCIQISTKQYRDLQCSEDHLLYASNRYDCNECRIWEWLEASELKPGDLVAIPQNTSAFSNETIFDPYLIGLLIGDGSYVKGSNPILFNCDQEVLDYVANNYKTVDCERSHITKDGRLFKALRINKIRDALRNLGIYGQTKLNKRLPEKIFSCCKHDCCELLAGLFDTDGCIRLGKSYGNRLPNSSALITTISIELAKQIRDLLQKIGVHASIQKKKPTKRSISRYKVVHDTYNVEIVDKQSLINLYLNVHPKIKYKQKALETIYESVKNRQRWRKNNFEYETIKSITNLGVNVVYDISTEKYHNYIAEGFINHNCAFDGLKDAFYHPSSYNIYEFPNIWDEDVDENSKCAFFVPQWANMEGFDEDGNQKYMDKDGNSLRDIAIRECVKQRKIVQEGKGDQQLLDRYVAERPLTPAEAMLELGGNIFPRKLLLNQLSKLRTNTKLQSMKHVVDLRWDGNGGVEAVEKKSGDITTYPLKNGEKPEGSIVIWEYPIKDPPFGLYIAGNDPYDQNESGTNSLGSTIIFKRFKAGEAWTDVIVAEYSGRPNTADEYYENVRKLLTFYNARCLYENEKLGIYQYFVNKHCDYLLVDQPDKVIAQIFRDSKVNRKKGCHMTKQVRQYAEEKINEWLREEYEPGHPNLERIYSEPLLEELIMNNGERNVDRVIALCMVMIYREELYQVKVQVNKDENKQVQLFEMPLFGTQWWSEPSQEDDVPIFTF